jgi:hypothetical protein
MTRVAVPLSWLVSMIVTASDCGWQHPVRRTARSAINDPSCRVCNTREKARFQLRAKFHGDLLLAWKMPATNAGEAVGVLKRSAE